MLIFQEYEVFSDFLNSSTTVKISLLKSNIVLRSVKVTIPVKNLEILAVNNAKNVMQFLFNAENYVFVCFVEWKNPKKKTIHQLFKANQTIIIFQEPYIIAFGYKGEDVKCYCIRQDDFEVYWGNLMREVKNISSIKIVDGNLMVYTYNHHKEFPISASICSEIKSETNIVTTGITQQMTTSKIKFGMFLFNSCTSSLAD